MDEIKKEFCEKINLIEDFIALSLRRENISESADVIVKEANKARSLMIAINKAIKNDMESLEVQYDTIMRRMRKQQGIILQQVLALTEQRRSRELEAAEVARSAVRQQCLLHPSSANKRCPPSNSKVLVDNMNKMHLSQGTPVATPRMNYKKSPLAKCINSVPFTLLDFEFSITAELFEKIPKYMRGRESVDDLNNFLVSIIVTCFKNKYQLLHRKRSSLRNRNELDIWKLYNEQVSYAPGRYFITAGDVSRITNKILDKKSLNRITMLRHIGVLHEQRVSQTVCYIWTAETF